MDIDAKLRPLYLLKILRDRTDEDHYLSTPQLCDILKNEFGIETFRTTIKSDIAVLQKVGFSVQETRSRQNLYNYIERDFDVPEVKLLIDAVMSSKFITKTKSERLTEKLTVLAGPFKSQELKRNLVVDGRIKAENEQIYMIVDAINEAINESKKIRFQMIEYNENKERILHNDGEVYVFSPYSLVWDGDFYYVVGYSEKHNGIGSHRVDRIYRRPEILDEPSRLPEKDFDINEYLNTMFRMYDAPRVEVELQADKDLMDTMIDRFGPDVRINDCSQESFSIAATVSLGAPFYSWVFGFQGKVKILSPQIVKDEYHKMVQAAYFSLSKAE